MPSRINWAIQSSGVDYLHLLIVSMEYLIRSYGINARLSITVHDEIRYLVTDEDAYRAAMALQISNLWTRAMFSQQVGLNDVPQVRSSSFSEANCFAGGCLFLCCRCRSCPSKGGEHGLHHAISPDANTTRRITRHLSATLPSKGRTWASCRSRPTKEKVAVSTPKAGSCGRTSQPRFPRCSDQPRRETIVTSEKSSSSKDAIKKTTNGSRRICSTRILGGCGKSTYEGIRTGNSKGNEGITTTAVKS